MPIADRTDVSIDEVELGRERRDAVLKAAEEQGLLGPRDTTIGGRVPVRLLERARERSGTTSTSELLLYALSKVALEDNFGAWLVSRSGRIPRGSLEG
jgi:hypothetical protein